ncbi:MAG: SRPBCC domain-containing protein [Treponema sp.]|nr:SRPBCC domain-containing protein [Treponema sp.]
MASISLTAIYSAPKEKVWEYLTGDALLGKWCMASDSFALERGREFRFSGDRSKFWDGVFTNTVVDFQDGVFLSYRCLCERPELDSLVTWTLRDDHGRAALSLKHSGFKPFKDCMFRIALRMGWKKMMEYNLRKELEG